MKILQSLSSRTTTEFGEELARSILKRQSSQRKNPGAIILALHGDLGAGKTTFTQGFAHGLGIKRRLPSPTFVIMRRYAIPGAGKKATSTRSIFKNLYHIDAYRIKKADALETLGIKEILSDPSAIVLIEWPENIKKLLPRNAIRIKFAHGKKENERRITMSAASR